MNLTQTEQASAIPLWLLAELTYACPLQCPYCSNPINFHQARSSELSTDEWIKTLEQARNLGAVQLGLSGGEPLVRQDLEEIISEAHRLGFYSNLITSAVGMNKSRLQSLKAAGLDHIQISFQAASPTLNNSLAGTDCFEHKLKMAKEVKHQGFPMVLNFVLHRHNIHQLDEILTLCERLEADYVELANTQYYGWGLKNRHQLLPTHEQLLLAEKITQRFRERHTGNMEVLFIVPDYYEGRPKACSNGWGTTFITVTPDGMVLPCQSAQELPGLNFPNVREQSLQTIWRDSSLFNAFRGDTWMQEPCRSCSEKNTDFGGCRCQAYLLTGDVHSADPVCNLSAQHVVVEEAINQAALFDGGVQDLVFRNRANARL